MFRLSFVSIVGLIDGRLRKMKAYGYDTVLVQSSFKTNFTPNWYYIDQTYVSDWHDKRRAPKRN